MIDITKIVPQGNRSLVQAYMGAKQTESGLHIAEKESDATPVMGTVIHQGMTSQYTLGQVLLFRRYAVDELKIQGENGEVLVYLIEDPEVIAVIEQ